MAAYGALLSLSHLLHQVLHPPPLFTNIITIHTQQIEFLRAKSDMLIDFLETYPTRRRPEIAELEARIRDAAYAAEDVIESDVVDQIRASDLYRTVAASKSSSLTKRISTLLSRRRNTPPILSETSTIERVLEEFISVERESSAMRATRGAGDLSPAADRPPPPPGGKTSVFMVGFDDHLLQIMSGLASDECSRRVIPIVGMGGIGKTKLARAVYNDLFIVEHFHVRAWVTVSQEYNVQELILCLLSEINKSFPDKQDSDEPGLQLHKRLFDRRYLIVMDDIWDIQAWNGVKRFLPDNGNGSRVLVTSRLSNLADDFGSCSPHKMDILDERNSWDLFRKIVLAEEDCPVELEGIGKYIVGRCQGLPLALVLIGGLLATYEREREVWMLFAGDVSSVLNFGNDEQVMKILSLSYTHLPVYLKPCFLYLAVFPEDFKIPVSRLIRLWVAEGLIKPTHDKCLEETAHDYLDDLVSRNLVLVGDRGSRGNVKSCKLHDLVRDLCVAEAEKEKFVCIAKLDNPRISPDLETARRLSVYATGGRPLRRTVKALQSASLNRSWLSPSVLKENWISRMKQSLSTTEGKKRILKGFRLLKVVYENDRSRLIEPSDMSNLRFVYAHSVTSVIPMALCWNLQTIIVVYRRERMTYIPSGIWLMPQLRHLKMFLFKLPNPPDHGQNAIVLENLQTIKGVSLFRFSEHVVRRIPNIKKLHAIYLSSSEGDFCLHNFAHFRKLESLRLDDAGKKLWPTVAFPMSLRKLALCQCKIQWEDLSVVGSLPNLEVLKLYIEATVGEEWNPVEGQFCRLKHLALWTRNLKTWGAESCHFPCLERLHLLDVPLRTIPASFSELLDFQDISLWWAEDSLWTSAKEISNEREQLGYEPLLLSRF